MLQHTEIKSEQRFTWWNGGGVNRQLQQIKKTVTSFLQYFLLSFLIPIRYFEFNMRMCRWQCSYICGDESKMKVKKEKKTKNGPSVLWKRDEHPQIKHTNKTIIYISAMHNDNCFLFVFFLFWRKDAFLFLFFFFIRKIFLF